MNGIGLRRSGNRCIETPLNGTIRPGEEIDKIVAQLYAASPALVERARKVMVRPKKKKKKKKK